MLEALRTFVRCVKRFNLTCMGPVPRPDRRGRRVGGVVGAESLSKKRHTHTLAQKCLIELLMWNASDVQRQHS